MLADIGAGLFNFTFGTGEFHGRSRNSELANPGMAYLCDHTPFFDMRIVDHLGDIVYRAAHDSLGFEKRKPFSRRLFSRDFVH